MDRDGVDAEVIFGVLGTASKMDDLPAANEVLRIYNDWLVDFCGHYPDRLPGPGCIPDGDIDAAVAMHRCAKMGLASRVSCSWDMELMWQPAGSHCGRRSTKRSCRCTHRPRPRQAATRVRYQRPARGDVCRRVGVPDGLDSHPRRYTAPCSNVTRTCACRSVRAASADPRCSTAWTSGRGPGSATDEAEGPATGSASARRSATRRRPKRSAPTT